MIVALAEHHATLRFALAGCGLRRLAAQEGYPTKAVYGNP